MSKLTLKTELDNCVYILGLDDSRYSYIVKTDEKLPLTIPIKLIFTDIGGKISFITETGELKVINCVDHWSPIFGFNERILLEQKQRNDTLIKELEECKAELYQMKAQLEHALAYHSF